MRAGAIAGLPVVTLLLALSALWAGAAQAEPVSGPHETIDDQLTTTLPNAPSGFSFSGTYHAAGDTHANPPYMRRMVFYPPRGQRYDTSVPDRCTASDLELETRGAAACPAGSRLGGGTTQTSFLGRFPSTLQVDLFNNTGEQVMIARSPGLAAVVRGHIRPDGSIEYASQTCYPTVDPVGCPVDDALQLSSSISMPPYTRSVGGATRSYLTTSPTCPAAGHWQTPVRFWWGDGSTDTVITTQPCTRSASGSALVKRRPSRRHHVSSHARS